MISNTFIQSLAIIAVILFMISFHAKSRRNILLLQIVSILIWATHFYLLSAWTGTVLIALNGLVTVLFLFKHQNKKLSSVFILYGSLLVFVMFTLLTWINIFSLFPLLAVSSIIIAKWQTNPNVIRIISFPASIFWIIYDVSVQAYGSIIAESLIILSIIISLLWNKDNKIKHPQRRASIIKK